MKPISILSLLSLVLVTSCQRQGAGSASGSEAASSPELVAVFVDRIAGDPVAIHVARRSVAPGEKVLLKGQVMGAVSPFVEGRAAFVVGDRELLTPCNEIPGDSCETPWDTCCETKEELRDGTATIQVVGEEGRVLKEGIKGVKGLEELSKVIVEGTVAEGSGGLVINASAIQVE